MTHRRCAHLGPDSPPHTLVRHYVQPGSRSRAELDDTTALCPTCSALVARVHGAIENPSGDVSWWAALLSPPTAEALTTVIDLLAYHLMPNPILEVPEWWGARSKLREAKAWLEHVQGMPRPPAAERA